MHYIQNNGNRINSIATRVATRPWPGHVATLGSLGHCIIMKIQNPGIIYRQQYGACGECTLYGHVDCIRNIGIPLIVQI